MAGLELQLLQSLYAQERLEFPSQRSMVHFACGEARARVSVLLLQHDSIDPNSPSAKATKAMAELLELASNCLRGGPSVKGSPEEANPLADLGSAFDQAVKGDPAALEAVLQRGELPSRPSIEP